MHIIITLPFTLLLLMCSSEAYPWLQQLRREPAVTRDLRQLSLSYQHCHLHIVLFDSEVDVHGMHNPYSLTRIREKDSSLLKRTLSTLRDIGGLAYPEMRHMVDHCQATFQVLPSKKHFNRLKKDDTFYAYKRGERTVRPHEGVLAWYKLKRRFSFLLVNYMARFRDPTALGELGGNLFVVMKYEGHKNGDSGMHNSLVSVTVICESCLQREQRLRCSRVLQCLHRVGPAHEAMNNDGRTVKWAFYRSSYPEDRGNRPNPRCFYCVRAEDAQNGQCTLSLKDALLNYIAGSLNASTTTFGFHDDEHPTTAIISWSEDTLYLESAATEQFFPLNLYPMISPNESVSRLRFVTADGVHRRIPYLAVYTGPLDLGTWLAALGLFIILITLITATSKSDNPRVSGGKVMQWSLFWLHGVLLDQVEFPLIPKVRSGFRGLIRSLLVGTFILSFALNNIYKSVLNINYVTGNELLCPWSRLDQLIDFSALYVPTGAGAWEYKESFTQFGETETFRLVSEISQTCGDRGWQEDIREMVDETLCTFKDEVISAFARVWKRGPSCVDKIPTLFQGPETDDTGCTDPRMISLLKYFSMFNRFRLADGLEDLIKNEMKQPGTALLVIERAFPDIWKKFAKAMGEDPSLKFGHNYLSDTDTTLFLKQRSRLLVASGMPESHTRLVTDRVHCLLASGTWEFWNSVSIRRMNERQFERQEFSAFTPISMNHDSMFALLLITGALTVLSTVSFLGSVCLSALSKAMPPMRLTDLLRKPTKVQSLPSNTSSSHELTIV